MPDPRNHPVLQLFATVADRVGERLRAVSDWGESGRRVGQYLADVDADAVAVELLVAAGYGVLSEESGASAEPGRGRPGTRGGLVVVDPLDGSTNASRGLPWYATALCLVDGDGPAAALVADQASGTRWWAVRGGGAWRGRGPGAVGAVALAPSVATRPAEAIVGISGPPQGDYGWAQFRALGASALDLCLVGAGTLDAYVDMSPDAHGVWDYLAATLICREAGAAVADAHGRELCVLDHAARRTPVAAATPALLDALAAVRSHSP